MLIVYSMGNKQSDLSYDTDELEDVCEMHVMMDSVVGTEMLPTDKYITFCNGHHVTLDTLFHMVDECAYRDILVKDNMICYKGTTKKAKYKLRCPAFDESDIMCNVKHGLRRIARQIDDKKTRKKFCEKVKLVSKRKMRLSAFSKISTLQECPNNKCIGEHKGIRSIGCIPSSGYIKAFSLTKFKNDRYNLRHCRDCNWMWCAECNGIYFNNEDDVHDRRTCAEVRLLRNPSESQLLTDVLIERISIQCPGCKQAIAVSSGCNKIFCIICKKHFCYLCHDRMYANTTIVYKHLKDVHGGFNNNNGMKRLMPPKKGTIDKLMEVHSM